MAEIKRIAHKIEYHIDKAGGVTFAEVANIRSIEDAEQSRETVDVTCLADTIMQEDISPLLQMGEVKLVLFWDEANTDTQGHLEDAIEADPQVTPNHKIVFPFADGTITKTFLGDITSLGPVTYEVGGEVTREVTINLNVIPTTT